jgi:hypothetical protein
MSVVGAAPRLFRPPEGSGLAGRWSASTSRRGPSILGRRKAAALGLTNIAFEVGDMKRLGYPDGCFDAVVSVLRPRHRRHDARAMAHGPPGGRLAVTTWGPRMLEPGTSSFGMWSMRPVPTWSPRSVPGTTSSLPMIRSQSQHSGVRELAHKLRLLEQDRGLGSSRHA